MSETVYQDIVTANQKIKSLERDLIQCKESLKLAHKVVVAVEGEKDKLSEQLVDRIAERHGLKNGPETPKRNK